MAPSRDSVTDILQDPAIADFMRTHHGTSEAVRRAATKLADENDAGPAVRKLLPALTERTLPVFFSYKKKDEHAAKAIVELLREKSAGKLGIVYQAEFGKDIVGRKWRDEIRASIARSNWFILLLPDPSDDWDWCLFETGFFEAQRTSGDRLICLHHPDIGVPDPIKDYHAVPATIPEVENLLQLVFVKDDPIPGMKAINPALGSQIPAIARQIVDAIRPPRKTVCRVWFEPWLELRVADAARLKSMDDLDAATLVSANREALALFEFLVKPATWGDLRSGLPIDAEDSRWREELFHVIRRISGGRVFYPIQAVFQTRDGRMYHPVASAVDRLGGENGPIETFHITFTEDVAAVDHSRMPKYLSALATVLRFTFRFRWEVLEKFTKGTLTELDVERIRCAMTRMQSEWQSRGVGDQAAVEGLFPDEVDRIRIRRMYARWALINNPEGTGELDRAIEQKDAQRCQEILKEIIPMNQEFLEMATGIFSNLIREPAETALSS
jgi:hypothetical protein